MHIISQRKRARAAHKEHKKKITIDFNFYRIRSNSVDLGENRRNSKTKRGNNDITDSPKSVPGRSNAM